MSGHSHWAGIKHKKGIADAKRGKIFSKFAKFITIAAKEKGGDLGINAKLRMAVEKARSFNMPKENIDRAIKKGTGEIEGAALEEFIYEGYGPGGIALIIEGVTDNKNRAISEMKHLLDSRGGKFAQEGSVKWMFERKGKLEINTKNQKGSTKTNDEWELIAIDSGADDISWNEDFFIINTRTEDIEKVKKALEEKEITIESASFAWVAKTPVEVTDQKTLNDIEKLFDALDENDDVQEIYSNLK